MTRNMAAGLAAGALAVGILLGASGAIVLGGLTDRTSGTWGGDHMGQMGGMGQMMGGWGMMGDGWDVDAMRELHARHHGGQP